MKKDVARTLDDILFAERNKDYGSYRLRKQYSLRLGISFLVSLAVFLALVLSYTWFLNSSGDATVYMFPSYGPSLKSTQSSLMSAEELKAFLNPSRSVTEQKPDHQERPKMDALHNFQLAENVIKDTFIPPLEEMKPPLNQGTGLGSENDSTVFGGYLLGTGEGGSSGNGLDRFPVFPGGLEAVRRYIELNVFYPTQAIKQKIHGVVLISFDVNKLGEVDNIKIERGIDPLIDAEAIKAIQKMPRWQPGMRRGRPVIVKFVIPVNFMPVS